MVLRPGFQWDDDRDQVAEDERKELTEKLEALDERKMEDPTVEQKETVGNRHS